jgi:alpha-galactosidase
VSQATRRRFLKLAASAGAVPVVLGPRAHGALSGAPEEGPRIGDGVLLLEFDAHMRSRLSQVRAGGSRLALTDWSMGEWLAREGGERIDAFALKRHTHELADGAHGRGVRLTLTAECMLPGSDGRGAAQLEKVLRVELFGRYPGFAFCQTTYRNLSSAPLTRLRTWHSADRELLPMEEKATDAPQFWSYCGSTHADRRDWVQPVRAGFAQDNYMGMTASDYGGGTPVVDVWRRDAGVAVGHLESTPRLMSLPVKHSERGVQLGISGRTVATLAPGEAFTTPETFICVHSGDYFHTLDTYRRIMAESGLCAPKPPPAAYEAIWCAWGYERECTAALIEGTLPKVQELGLSWAVIDDGWQTNVGDWQLDPKKFPGGEADMKHLVADIRGHSLKPRLWVAPLAAAPGSDVLHDHTDMLLLNKDGAPQAISWWNCFYLCPAYDKTVAYTEQMVRRFIGEWGFAGLKIDGQHLNGVAPCYNPAHHHARPEESVEKLQDFFHALYLAATRINPEVVMELCPCGTAFSFFNFVSMNQAPASDPESSWQVRHKGKTFKALMGPEAAFAGDHVELSDGGDDFASTVGIGAIVSTKFTWPKDPKPKDSFLLTPEREVLWRKWIALYNEHRLPEGTYRGELYDIGFDRPETHVVEKSGRLYYAFYGRNWRGPVTLRGLASGRHRVRDYFSGHDLGEIAAPNPSLPVAFDRFLLLETTPI